MELDTLPNNIRFFFINITFNMRFSPIFFVNLHQNKKKHRI